ncbi:hypothetical protein [Kordiimonas sp.]
MSPAGHGIPVNERGAGLALFETPHLVCTATVWAFNAENGDET